MFAVVKIGSSQYLVKPDQEILIDYQKEARDKLVFDQVLLVADEDKVLVGQPLVSGARVEARVLAHPKGTKIRIATFKAKSRYRKVKGFRPHYTKIKISDILLSGAKTPAPATVKSAVKKKAVRRETKG
jgi:large subunit ribosomal protein L21